MAVASAHNSEQAPIVLAAAKGDVTTVKRILAQNGDWSSVNKIGFDPDDPSVVNQTAVIAAVKGKHVDVLRVLVRYNVDPDAVNWVGQTAMYWAKKANDQEMIALLARQHNQLRLDADLIKVAKSGDLQATLATLHNGARANIPWFWTHRPYERHFDGVNYQDTPLIAAAQGGNLKIIRTFLRLHAKVNGKNFVGETPLLGAAQHGNAEAVSLLLERGADVNAVDSSGITPLMAACEHGFEHVVRLLLARKPNVNAQSNGHIAGQTALSLAQEGLKYAADKDRPRFQRIVQVVTAAGGKTFPTHRRMAL